MNRSRFLEKQLGRINTDRAVMLAAIRCVTGLYFNAIPDVKIQEAESLAHAAIDKIVSDILDTRAKKPRSR